MSEKKIPTASLFLVVGGAPNERYPLVRRAPLKKPDDPGSRQSYRYVLQPPVSGKLKAGVDPDPLACIRREAAHEGGAAFAAFLLEQDFRSFMPLPEIAGYEHVTSFALAVTPEEFGLYVAGPEFCETLELTGEEVGGIEAIDVETDKQDGVARDSRMMFPDHRLCLRALLVWMRG